MKALNTCLGLFAVSLVATSCTIRVGDGDFDSGIWDDPFFNEDSGSNDPDPIDDEDSGRDPEPEPTDDPIETPDADVSEPDAATSSAPSASSPAPSESASATAAPSSTGSVPPSSYLCSAPEEMDECDRCLEQNCQVERADCCGSNCEVTWPKIQLCMAMIEDAGDPDQAVVDLDACLAAADPNGDAHAFDMDMEFQLLLSCANAEYTGETTDDPFDHQAGDGTCTLACYGVPFFGQ
jgi:hypothetical protein